MQAKDTRHKSACDGQLMHHHIAGQRDGLGRIHIRNNRRASPGKRPGQAAIDYQSELIGRCYLRESHLNRRVNECE